MKNTTAVLDLGHVKASMLIELQGYKESQLKVVEENPFIEITDRDTYEEGKKRRTALVKARTGYQRQETIIKDKLNSIKKQVSEMLNDDVIAITKPYEEKQQEEVSRWEAILEEKRQEKARIEAERVSGINSKIQLLDMSLSAIIIKMVFNTIEAQREAFLKTIELTKLEVDFEEFEVLVDEKIKGLTHEFDGKVLRLKEVEKNRLDRLKASQKSNVDAHYMEATKILQGATIQNKDLLINAIQESFEDDMDFGEFSGEHEKNKEYLLGLAQKKVSDLEAEKIATLQRIETEAAATQAANLADLQSHLMNTVLSMDEDTYEIATVDINNLKSERKGYSYMEDKFDAMVRVIEKIQDEKLSAIEKKLQERRRLEKLNERMEHMTMLGMESDGGVLIGFGKSIGEKIIEYSSDGEFELMMQSVAEAKNLTNKEVSHLQEKNKTSTPVVEGISCEDLKNSLQEVSGILSAPVADFGKETLKGLSNDVLLIQGFLSDLQGFIDWNLILGSMETKEGMEFFLKAKKQLDSWFEQMFNEAENL